MTGMTTYAAHEKSTPSKKKMFVSSMRLCVDFKTYMRLVHMLGLIREPNLACWVGGWPVFMLPSGEVFEIEVCTNEHARH